jgi:tetratricopeptide (TPR) repeat protein
VLAAAPAVAAPAAAAPRSTLDLYAEARAASNSGAFDRASADYGTLLGAVPDNEMIATQALGHAVTAGNWPLALDAAHMLDRRGAMRPDARFVLLAEAFKARDWRTARAQIELIESERLFAFAVPVLRAWLAIGSGEGDPLAALAAADANGPAAAYAAEHRPLILLVLGRAEAPGELLRAARSAGGRGDRLRVAGAALLARRDRAAALTLLDTDNRSVAAARRLLAAGQPLPGAIAGADAGLAELLVRLAVDLRGQELVQLAGMFGRLATWLAPDSAEAWMVAADLYAEQDKHDLAIELMRNIPAGDPFAEAARDERIRLLVQGGAREAALGEALAATRAAGADAGDWVRLGEVYSRLDRHAEAADAFGRALAVRNAQDDQAEWTMLLARGGALDEAGNWPGARDALRRAYALAPEQPFVLNYLGYAQLVRRENVVEAERLVREAHRLAPDNAAITDSLGWALYLKGDFAGSIALLEQAAQAEPADVEINEHLGDAYYAAGRRVEARFAWRAASVYAEGAAVQRIAGKIDTGLPARIAQR